MLLTLILIRLSDASDVSSLIQHFSFHDVGTRTHVLYCSDAQTNLQGSDSTSLPTSPLCLCHIDNYQWVGMLRLFFHHQSQFLILKCCRNDLCA